MRECDRPRTSIRHSCQGDEGQVDRRLCRAAQGTAGSDGGGGEQAATAAAVSGTRRAEVSAREPTTLHGNGTHSAIYSETKSAQLSNEWPREKGQGPTRRTWRGPDQLARRRRQLLPRAGGLGRHTTRLDGVASILLGPVRVAWRVGLHCKGPCSTSHARHAANSRTARQREQGHRSEKREECIKDEPAGCSQSQRLSHSMARSTAMADRGITVQPFNPRETTALPRTVGLALGDLLRAAGAGQR